jgi:predicted ribosomally synthesized peptide with nif11-like leader
MSVENAKLLINKIQADKSLQTKLNTALQDTFTEIAKKEGLSCTVQDFNTALKEVRVRTNIKDKIGQNAIVAVVSVAVV